VDFYDYSKVKLPFFPSMKSLEIQYFAGKEW